MTEEITVTATLREEKVQDVPFSVAAPTEEELRERGVDRLEPRGRVQRSRQPLHVSGFENLTGIPTAGRFGAPRDVLYFSRLKDNMDQFALFGEASAISGRTRRSGISAPHLRHHDPDQHPLTAASARSRRTLQNGASGHRRSRP